MLPREVNRIVARGDNGVLQEILGHASIVTLVDSYGELAVDNLEKHNGQVMDKEVV